MKQTKKPLKKIEQTVRKLTLQQLMILGFLALMAISYWWIKANQSSDTGWDDSQIKLPSALSMSMPWFWPMIFGMPMPSVTNAEPSVALRFIALKKPASRKPAFQKMRACSRASSTPVPSLTKWFKT